MEISNLIPHIESLIFASEKPLTSLEITDLINNAFGFMEDKILLDQIETAIEGILEKYKSEFYPFEIRQSGGGWQFLTKREYHKTVAQLNGEKFLKRLSSAALETLSIIAYKQPVTKAEIEAIRGVSSDYAVQKLLEKDLIVINGRNESMPGHPLVYGTSKNFMDYFGLNSAEDLPKLKEVYDETLVNATPITGDALLPADTTEAAEETELEEAISFVVSETGELIVEEAELTETENPVAETDPEASENIDPETGADPNTEEDSAADEPAADTGETDEDPRD